MYPRAREVDVSAGDDMRTHEGQLTLTRGTAYEGAGGGVGAGSGVRDHGGWRTGT